MKKDLTNPLVIISFFLIISTIFLSIYFYFVKPFIKNNKEEVTEELKKDLELLTTAYLDQNPELDISKLFFDIHLNEYEVASEYYYLKNGKDGLDKYEEILAVAKKIFADERIEFSNFTVNLDECGKEKYSTIEGFIYSDTCDLQQMVFKIGDIYKKDDLYIVEFNASFASQTLKNHDSKCDEGHPFSYDLKLTNLESFAFQNNSYAKCLDEFNYGIFYLKDEILESIKNYKYKLSFKKNDSHFTFYNLEK